MYRNLTGSGEQGVAVKTVTVRDSTGHVKVSLWRDLANTPTPVNSYYEITDVRMKDLFRGEYSFNSTTTTTLKVFVCFLPSSLF